MKPTVATAFKFLKNHTVAVLATVSESSHPSTTPLYYTVTANKTIIFVTKDGTTKYKHLLRSKHVAVSVVDYKAPIAVNLVGKARIIKDKVETKSALRKVGKINRNSDLPPVLKHTLGDIVVIEITPSRVQYTDYRSSNDEAGQYIFNL